MRIELISKKKSKAAQMLLDETKLRRYSPGRKGTPDLIVNYGLAGKTKQRFFSRNPKLQKVPVINYICGYNKYSAVKIVKKEGLPVPNSKSKLNNKDVLNDWLLKKINSYGGKDIKVADKRNAPVGFYFQEYIRNRSFELRIHAFTWTPKNDWVIQKRIGNPKEVAWNYSAGGYFVTVHNNRYKLFQEALSLSKNILSVLKMEFGAVDFLVDNDNNIYFIEINSQPGFSGLSDSIYINAMNHLFDYTPSKINKVFNHHF